MASSKKHNWEEIQKSFNEGLTQDQVSEKHEIGIWSIGQAQKNGLIKTNNRKTAWKFKQREKCTPEELEKFDSGEYKRCYNCQELKHVSVLRKRKSLCLDCNTEINKKHYYQNPSAREEAVLRLKDRRDYCRIKLCKYLEDKSCAHCPENDPIVLEFDHLQDKKGNISNLVNVGNWDVVLEEIQKCQILCANCHNRKTAKEKNHLKYRYFTAKKENQI